MPQRNKILFVFPNTQLYGGENVWLSVIRGLDRDKFSPYVVAFGDGPLRDSLKALDVSYEIMPKARIRNVFGFLRNLKNLVKIIKRENIELINSLGVHFMSNLAAKWTRIPYCLHIHTIHKLKPIDEWAVKDAPEIITICEYSRDELVSYGVSRNKINIVTNGMDIGAFTSGLSGGDVKAEFGIKYDTKLVTYVGRVVVWKNLDILIRKIPDIKSLFNGEVKFMFVGDTPADKRTADYKDELLRLAGELGVADDVVFAGRRKDVADILKSTDVFVLPSLLDTVPICVLEAMAMAKPVVAFEVGGLPEMVDDTTGSLLEVGDVDGFAVSVAALLNDPVMAAEKGEAGKRRVHEKFSQTECTKEAEDVFFRILNR